MGAVEVDGSCFPGVSLEGAVAAFSKEGRHERGSRGDGESGQAGI